MSIRRKAGDWVWLRAGAGMTGESNRLRAEIQADCEDDNDPAPCLYNCGDAACREWYDLLTAPDPQANGKRHMLYHVSECEMFDEKQEARNG